MRDLYADLNVSPRVSPDDLRKQYRKLAMQWHPDRHVGQPTLKSAEEQFQRIQAAYDVLSDPARRAEYDRTRTQPRGYGERSQTPTDGDLDGWYREAMRAAQQTRPSDYAEFLKDFDLEDDTQTVLPLSVPFAFADQGVTGVLDRVNVRVPPACRDGVVLTAVNGQKYRVQILYPKGLSREKDDLVLSVDLPLPNAILGGAIQLLHWDKRTLSVSWPANSYTGKRLRLKGCGALLSNGTRGDLYLQSNVVFQNFNPLELEGIKKLVPPPELLLISPKWDT